jgi:class 3 adenylate cyclase
VGAASLFEKDPATSRFLSGGLAEAESLLGAPLPNIPLPDVEAGRPVWHVQFAPQLRTLLVKYLHALLREIGADLPGPKTNGSGKEQAEYEAALERVLRSVRISDRRIGLLNLCWLAHSRDVAEILRELEAKSPQIKKLKYSLHPLLSSYYKRLDNGVRRGLEQADAGQAALLIGARENTAVVDAIIDDGFAFTEVSISDFDFNAFLAANKRYRLPADVFFEIYSILLRETEKRLREGDRGLQSRIARHMPGLPKDQLQSPANVVKIMMNAHVLTYLLGDVLATGSKILASDKVRAEAERRKSAEILEVFLDLVNGVKRFELVSHLRDHVMLVRAGEQVLQDRASGRRLFAFGESSQVLNNAINATVLFLDLRGFTQTSEGHISERDLTQELYTVFDAFVPHVRRFGGTIDKFLGDGIMVTWGTRRVDPLDPLNALRTAILCQETLQRLRREKKTFYKMGVAIHYGRVYTARFIADEESVQTTVIGRNVNLAGRLSSAAKKQLDEDEPEPAAPAAAHREFQVTVDGLGTLFNEGVAISRDTLVQLENNLPLVHNEAEGSRHMEYFDEQIGRRLLIRYAGDAKFKGVRSSFPVYEVDFAH